MTQRQAAAGTAIGPAIRLRGVEKIVTGRSLFADVTCAVPAGSRICLVGARGSGTSTLLQIMAGLTAPSAGTAERAAGLRVGFLAQDPQLDPAATVRDVLEDAVAGLRADLRRVLEISTLLAARPDDPGLLTELGDLSERLERGAGWDLPARVTQVMRALHCPEPDAAVASLSNGERRRVALCRALVPRPELLFLDEPTSDLDPVGAQWLQQHLIGYPGTVVVITHDPCLLEALPQWILELDRGQAWRYDGNYRAYLQRKVDRLAVPGRLDPRRRRRLHAELQWLGGPAAGRRPVRVPPGERPGEVVVEATGIGKACGGRVLVEDLSCRLRRGSVVAVIGPDGVGRTTLLRMIAGLEPVDRGRLRLGAAVRVAHLAASGMRADQQDRPVDLLLLDEPSRDLDPAAVASLERALTAFPGCAVIASHDRWLLQRVSTHVLAWAGDRDRPGRWTWFDGPLGDYLARHPAHT